jgi:hypothetical protein
MGNNYMMVEGTLVVHLVCRRMHTLELGQGEWVHQNSVVLCQGDNSELHHLMEQFLVEGSELLGAVVEVDTAHHMEVGLYDLVQGVQDCRR